MINQRIFLNVLDENQKPISRCRVKIENRREKYEADTDFAGIVEFLVPLGVYVLTLEHPLFKRKVYRMTLRDGFSFSRIILKKDNLSTYRRNKIPMKEYIKNTEVDYDIDETDYNIDETDYDVGETDYDVDETDYEVDEADYDVDEVDYNSNKVINENSKLRKNKNNLDIDEEASVRKKVNRDLDIKIDDKYKMESQDGINIGKEYFKGGSFFEGKGIWGTTGVFDGLNEEDFEEILNGAKSILKDILDFANSIDNEEYEVQEDNINYERNLNKEPKLSDNYLKKRRKIDFDDSWEVEEIKGSDKNYNGDTFDVDDYEEEILNRIKEKEEY
ncbi:hypothetical protein QYB59_000389 [Clostridium perfringens]|nr:hypothetical protein [Clostridium perfringens]